MPSVEQTQPHNTEITALLFVIYSYAAIGGWFSSDLFEVQKEVTVHSWTDKILYFAFKNF